MTEEQEPNKDVAAKPVAKKAAKKAAKKTEDSEKADG